VKGSALRDGERRGPHRLLTPLCQLALAVSGSGLFRKGCVNWFTLPSHSYSVSLMVGNELNSTGVGSPVIMRLTWLASLKLRCVRR